MTNERTKLELLLEINRDIPVGVDWYTGARRYVSSKIREDGREAVELHALTKPLAILGGDEACLDAIRAEVKHYLYNFVNLVHRVKPTAGMKVLDVACGGGWMSHYMTRLGCHTLGIDISQEFVELARRRFLNDPYLGLSPEEVERRFVVHDLEEEPLTPDLDQGFDLIVLESCLHHFVDPIAAMTHVSRALKDDGIVVVIEGENRHGPLKDEYLSVMKSYNTLERPYFRSHLNTLLDMAGLPEREFLGQLNGWFMPSEPAAVNATEIIAHTFQQMNLCICAKHPDAMSRIFPNRKSANVLDFGRGWFDLENNFRWCGPSGVITARKPLKDFRLELFGHKASQIVVAYGPDGERGRVKFDNPHDSTMMRLGDLSDGDVLTMCSNEVFSPSWSGSEDRRLLSFFAKTIE